jgi:glutathione synthase/RimK-type ligase-like ATP-grasp enzyme
MKVAIAKAYNGLHLKYQKYFKSQNIKTVLFDIDCPDWIEVEKKHNPDFYFWYADQKEHEYSKILDKVLFIENIFQKKIFPSSKMYFFHGDKTKQYQLFKSLGLPHIPTNIFFKKELAQKFIDQTKYPFILKDPYGYNGLHLFQIKNKKEAQIKLNKIFDKGLLTGCSLCKDIFYTQKFITIEKDLRVITLGNKAISAYWRTSDHWKHNVHLGGQISFDDIPQKALDQCLGVSKKMKFDWMAYDLIIKNDKIYFIELACNFGTKGADMANINVRQKQVDYIIKKNK